MKYVLILFLATIHGAAGGGVAAEFETRAACEAALAEVVKASRHSGSRPRIGICAPKGKEE